MKARYLQLLGLIDQTRRRIPSLRVKGRAFQNQFTGWLSTDTRDTESSGVQSGCQQQESQVGEDSRPQIWFRAAVGSQLFGNSVGEEGLLFQKKLK